MIDRTLSFRLPPRQSCFLWGPRKAGKSTYLQMMFPDSFRVDLLNTDRFFELSREPWRLREELSMLSDAQRKRPIIIDEVQKVPPLLDEVHWLIENKKLSFILCGSSARKLKRGGANLLGGRAWRFVLHPFICSELKGFDLLKALRCGLLPSHYLGEEPKRSIKAYVNDYLNEEIRAEALTRNLPAFSRFVEAASFSMGELVNFSNIGRDCGVDSKTIKEYFHILEDTLLGYFVYPFAKSRSRQVISSVPKFYFCDTGITHYLRGFSVGKLKGTEAGRLFEQFILMELVAFRDYTETDMEINFWRTKAGQEVDYVLNRGQVAIEVKLKDRLDRADYGGLLALHDEVRIGKLIVVCLERRPRRIDVNGCKIDVLPWKDFLRQLWNKEMS